ncbi:hypothetical protein EV363DRAFT_1385187 [Boletus edulis]|nr:hypothetical protein EV363DRAFT_1385187 [Boletus edulis]
MAVAIFSENGEHIFGSYKNGIQVWRGEDLSKEIATLKANKVTCLAVSKNNGWIAAGTGEGDVLMWDAKTHEQVFMQHEYSYAIAAVDFSPDSTRLVSSTKRTATVWDITTSKRLQTLDHEAELGAAKYSPEGDRIATATTNSVRIYDSNNSHLHFHLVFEIPVRVTSSSRLLWFGNHLFVTSDSTIKQFEASTGSATTEWQVPHSKDSCIALPQHGKFIAYSAKHTVTFWDTLTLTQFGLIQHPQEIEISSLAFSPDDRFLAIGALDGKIIIRDLTDSFPSYYSAVHRALAKKSLIRVLIKRSKAYVASDLWGPALNDANKIIELDPSSPWGYERKHAALHKAGDYENATRAFETMLSKMSQSSDPEIHKLHRQYMDTKAAIRDVIQDAIRDSPRVLINTSSGRLLSKAEQAVAFESLPVFNELITIASMTTTIDHARIKHDVMQYYRYAMLSHTWGNNEPLFEELTCIIAYDLEESPTNDKLKIFCKIVRDAGFHWAWSDTCCIDKGDHSVLQEALVAMFKWYQGSALTLVFLRGVRSPSRRGDLVRSIWNSRAWTLLEYRASKVVRFYNEDWTLYMNLDIPNHKDSPEILLEMVEATGISARTLMGLQPGLDSIREKLSLVSRRETSLVEDAAYSLFGIFSISLPVVYGEGDQALGRLLAQLLTSSGDTSVLAWTGKPGSHNSCLPSSITVFSELPTSHIPPPMTYAEMQTTTARLRKTFNLASVVKFYGRLSKLPVPSFTGRRMKLPCIAFKLGPLSVSRSHDRSAQVFRAQTTALGLVEIRTEEDLPAFNSLYLVHPWIDFLLDQQPVRSVSETLPDDQSFTDEVPSPSHLQISGSTPPLGMSFGERLRDATSLSSPSHVSLTDKLTPALRSMARLGQPFGALLFTPTRENVAEYRRVASESVITVRVQDDTPPQVLMACVQTLDVL